MKRLDTTPDHRRRRLRPDRRLLHPRHARAGARTSSIWFDILAAIAFVLGGGNLLKVHLQEGLRPAGRAGRTRSITVVAFSSRSTSGLRKIGVQPERRSTPTTPWSGSYREIGSPFWWLYEYAFKPLHGDDVRDARLLRRVGGVPRVPGEEHRGDPAARHRVHHPARPDVGRRLPDRLAARTRCAGLRLENLTVYIMQVFNTAGNRAIMIGIALGIASMSLKILLGVDRSYLGSGDE